MSLPKITATGNLTRDPDLKWTSGGRAVVNFTIACSDGKKDDPKARTTFIDCVAWNDIAETIANKLHKGQRVNVTGRLEQRSYEAKDGTKRTVFEVGIDTVGPDLRFMGSGQRTSPPTAAGDSTDDPWGYPALDEPPAF